MATEATHCRQNACHRAKCATIMSLSLPTVRLPASCLMTPLAINSDRQRTRLLLARCSAVCAVLICFGAGSLEAKGSITGPQCPEFCLEPSTLDGKPDGAVATGASSDHQGDQRRQAESSLTMLVAKHGSSEPSSSSRSTSSSAASSSAALANASTGDLFEPGLTEWLLRERHDALPAPPGKNAFRPPIA